MAALRSRAPHALQQFPQHLLVKSGANLPCIDELAGVVVVAHEQTAEARA
jgi:hypothetical protein